MISDHNLHSEGDLAHIYFSMECTRMITAISVNYTLAVNCDTKTKLMVHSVNIFKEGFLLVGNGNRRGSILVLVCTDNVFALCNILEHAV